MAELMSLTEAEAERDHLERQLKAIRAYIKVVRSQQPVEEPSEKQEDEA